MKPRVTLYEVDGSFVADGSYCRCMTTSQEVPAEVNDARGRVAELVAIRAEVAAGPSEKATEAQRAKGKLTARERIDLLLDEGTFREVEPLRRHRATGFGLEAKRPYTDGVVTGWGTVHGRTVFVYAHDFRIFGGALGEAHATKIHKIMDMAITAGAPLISLNDGAGARIQEGVSALAGRSEERRVGKECSAGWAPGGE